VDRVPFVRLLLAHATGPENVLSGTYRQFADRDPEFPPTSDDALEIAQKGFPLGQALALLVECRIGSLVGLFEFVQCFA
jgi:hypothetical protein